jgi:hypothetical protein
MGDFLFQFVVPTLDVIYGTGYICVEVVPYVSVTVDPLGYNIVRECNCVGWCISAEESVEFFSIWLDCNEKNNH